MWIVSIDGMQAINSAHIRRIVIEEKPGGSTRVNADLGEEIPFVPLGIFKSAKDAAKAIDRLILDINSGQTIGCMDSDFGVG